MRRTLFVLGVLLAFAAGALAQSIVGPPLPSRVQGLAGPIAVVMSDTLTDSAGMAGHWNAITRVIHVQRGSAVFERQVVFHELFHALLWDAGHQIGGPTEERLADLVGAAMSTSGCVFR